MNLLQLEYFQEVARHQSITQAAKALNISQSALSIMISKLESEVGYPLFSKQGRNIVITAYGEQVLHYSYILLQEMEDIQKEFRELRGEENEWKITLGVTDSNYYGDWILNFMAQYPDLQINVLQMSREEIFTNLRLGLLDFGLSNGAEYYEEISSKLLFSQPYQLLVRGDHRLAKRGMITMEEMVQEPLLSLPPSHKNRMVDNLALVMGFQPNIIFEGNADIMDEMFRAGVGSILTCAHNRAQWMRNPILGADYDERDGYVLLNIVGVSARYEMYLMWMKNRYLPKCARIFQDYVIDYYHV